MRIMKKNLLLLSLLTFFFGCAGLPETANRGIKYGMTPEKVIQVNKKKGYRILGWYQNTVVVKGMQEKLNQPAIKSFYFEDGKLVSITEKIEE